MTLESYSCAFACLQCRRSFKRQAHGWGKPEKRRCPHCGEDAFNLGRDCKPPAKNDSEQWKKVDFLIAHGFRFQKIHEPERGGLQVKYPETLEEAKSFVKKYRDQAMGVEQSLKRMTRGGK